MLRYRLILLLFPLVFLQSCLLFTTKDNTTKQVSGGNTADTTQQHLLQSTLWMQNAAEYRALCWQAFRSARYSLDDMLTRIRLAKPAAVVVDIDETVLDNSPYSAFQVLEDQAYSGATWTDWTNLVKADTIPGALWFLKHAASKGVDVFYISNRKEASEFDATLKNLQKFGFPNADAQHLLLKTTTSNKEARRQKVEESHTILMLCGDNINDFAEVWEKKTTAERNQLVDQRYYDFGSRFIVLPNPVYGSYQSALFEYSYKWSKTQQDSIRKANLRSYR